MVRWKPLDGRASGSKYLTGSGVSIYVTRLPRVSQFSTGLAGVQIASLWASCLSDICHGDVYVCNPMTYKQGAAARVVITLRTTLT